MVNEAVVDHDMYYPKDYHGRTPCYSRRREEEEELACALNSTRVEKRGGRGVEK